MQKGKSIDIISIILVLILMILLFCYAQLKLLEKDYINLCGYTIFQVITGSMEDTIKIGDIVIVKLTDNVSKNDIITYKNNGNFITHRIIQIDENKLITKGDANNSEDSPIEREDIVGKVVFIISNVAIWINVIKTPQVIIAIIFTIFALKILLKRNKNRKRM